ncbi:unnamed protein product [Aureobasidium uvarum]|uniref:Uncharacterized protein n=1 Tax=Aureobasidium uvarum TaxID=2773716 RepID=A0A9N8PTL8_9PEZI|nr:unnamed protein product [Aureobasidium uvarum]
MNIAAMLEPIHDAPHPVTASSSSSQLLQRLPAITHVTPGLQQQPVSSHQIPNHPGLPIEPHSALPPRRHALPQRMDSISSNNSSTHGSIDYTTQPYPSSSSPSTTQRPRSNSTVRRDSSVSPSQANSQPRHRGKQTKAACIPCRKRKSKVLFLLPSTDPLETCELNPATSTHAATMNKL